MSKLNQSGERSFFLSAVFSGLSCLAIAMGLAACGKSSDDGSGTATPINQNQAGYYNPNLVGYLNQNYNNQPCSSWNVVPGTNVCRTEIPIMPQGSYGISGTAFPRMNASGIGGSYSYNQGYGIQVKAGDRVRISMNSGNSGSGESSCSEGNWWIFNWSSCTTNANSCRATPLDTSEQYQGKRKGLLLAIDSAPGGSVLQVLEPSLNGDTVISTAGTLRFGINTPIPSNVQASSCAMLSINQFSLIQCRDTSGNFVACPSGI